MTLTDKYPIKRALLIDRTSAVLGVDRADSEQLLAIERFSSFRMNPLKVSDNTRVVASLTAKGWHGEESIFMPGGFSIHRGRREVVDSEEHATGQLFIQNQASWLPVLALEAKPEEKILDMCAAPGGKAVHIAGITENRADLWVNDNSRARLYKLRANFDRLGARYSNLTMYGIDRIGRELEEESFDKILLDAPCSGEGMMHIDKPKDFFYWSTAQIKRLQQLQKKAISSAWQLLKPGGTLVYSTCTMAPEENEAVIDYLLTKNQNAQLQPLIITLPNKVSPLQVWQNKTYKNDLSACLRLKPSSLIEAFFVAKLYKNIHSE